MHFKILLILFVFFSDIKAANLCNVFKNLTFPNHMVRTIVCGTPKINVTRADSLNSEIRGREPEKDHLNKLMLGAYELFEIGASLEDVKRVTPLSEQYLQLIRKDVLDGHRKVLRFFQGDVK